MLAEVEPKADQGRRLTDCQQRLHRRAAVRLLDRPTRFRLVYRPDHALDADALSDGPVLLGRLQQVAVSDAGGQGAVLCPGQCFGAGQDPWTAATDLFP